MKSRKSRTARFSQRRAFFERLESRQMFALGAEFLGDMNAAVSKAGSDPREFVEMNGEMYFTATSPTFGRELWKTNGTAEGTIRLTDLSSDFGDDAVGHLTAVNDTLFFLAEDAIHGRELWKTDGNAAGTSLVKDIRPGIEGSIPSALVNFQGTLFFSASTSENGTELWRSDGTEAGTVLVADLNPGGAYLLPNSSYPHSFVEFQGKLFFQATSPGIGSELFCTDGTGEGTRLVKDIQPDTLSGFLGGFTVAGGSLYFFAITSDGTRELWKSDGTEEGTVFIVKASTSSNPSRTELVALGDDVIFTSAPASSVKREIWKTDGTAEGTVNISPETDGSVTDLFAANGRLFFTTMTSAGQGIVWSSDGTSAGAVQLATGGTGGVYSFIAGPDAVYFRNGTVGPAGLTIWKTDGTVQGTVALGSFDLKTTYYLTYPSMGVLNGKLIWAADDDAHGLEMWTSDGTAVGTRLLKDISAGTGDFIQSPLVEMGGWLYFAGDDGLGRKGLWRTDGTSGGTEFIKSLSIEMFWDSPLCVVNDTLFFSAARENAVQVLWKSNGTAEGTVAVVDDSLSNALFGRPRSLTRLGNEVFFAARSSSFGEELWKSDGTASGTVQVKDISPGRSSSSPMWLTEMNGTLFFDASSLTGHELWRSDGTEEGTYLVKDIYPSAESSDPWYLTNVNGTLYFSASQISAAGDELWKSDGTAEGTVQVKDLAPGYYQSSSPFAFAGAGDTLYFLAHLPEGGIGLYTSKGTADTTTLVKKLSDAERAPANFRSPIFWQGKLFFEFDDGIHGRELWVSDGTAEGTRLLYDMAQAGDSSPRHFVPYKNSLYFVADNADTGAELWRVSEVSEKPVVTLSGDRSYVENGKPMPISLQATVTDADSPHFNGGTLTVQLAANGEATDRLGIRSAGDVVVAGNEIKFKGIVIGTFTGGEGTTPLAITFNARASAFRVQMVLRNVTYHSISQKPSPLTREISVQLTDGKGGKSLPATVSVHVTPVNDAPRLNNALSPTLNTIKEDQFNSWGTPIWQLLQGAYDADADAVKGLALTSANSAKGEWIYTLDNGVTWQSVGAVSASSALLLPANGNFSRLRFIPKTDFHGTVQIGYFAWDQTQGTAGGRFDLSGGGKIGGTTAFSAAYETASLTVTPMSESPLVLLNGRAEYTLNASPVFVAPDAAIRDPDSVSFEGGLLKVRIDQAELGDRLSIGGPFKIVDGNLIWNNSAIMGTVQADGDGTSTRLVVSFNANATRYRVEMLLRSVQFSTVGGTKTGVRTLSYEVNDGTTPSGTAGNAVIVM